MGLRIRVLSDLHEELAHRVGGSLEFEPLDVDVTVLAGDIANGVGAVEVALRPCFANSSVILVPGNHEYYDGVMPQVMAAMRERIALAKAQGHHHVHLLDNQTVLVDNTLFIGGTLWTDYALYGDVNQSMLAAKNTMADYRLIQTTPNVLLTANDTVAMHHRGRQFFTETLQAHAKSSPCVVVSHHAPHAKSIHPRFADNRVNPAFVSDLTPLLGQSDLWIHGHTHDGFDYQVSGTRIVANPAGYRKKLGAKQWAFENQTYDPNKVVVL
jgi:predicted phosphodiesterase